MNSHVSIIIPVKNEEKRLPICLDAIRKLAYDARLIEIIVVDNGSVDSTRDIAQEYGCRVLVEPDCNVSGLRNVGASHATGAILCFVDADIAVSPNWLSEAVKLLEPEGIGCVTGELNIPSNASWVARTWALDRRVTKNSMEVQWTSSMNMIVKKTVFDALEGFSDTLVTGEDVEFCHRLRMGGDKILWHKDVSVVHHGEANTVRQFIAKERWRGYSDLDLLLQKKFRLGNLRHGTRPIFFIISFGMAVIASCSGDFALFGLSMSALFLLPFTKTVRVSVKQQSVRYAPSLFVLWNLYYVARSIAIFDNIKKRFTNLSI